MNKSKKIKIYFYITYLFCMISLVKSIAVNWLNSNIIEVEVDINNGLPSFTIVGLPDQGIQESRERIRSALKSSGDKLPASRITVNLAPADIRKAWPIFDLAIAVGILLNSWTIKNDELIKTSIFLGELSLDGKLRSVWWILPATIWASEKGFTRIFVPQKNAREASFIPGIDVISVDNLSDLIEILNWEKTLSIAPKLDFSSLWKLNFDDKYDFRYIIWQTHAKRAMEIAAAGWHNIIMSWPPWSWKTLLAKTFATILPEMTLDEAIEVSKIYSISGLLSDENPIITTRPFRSVHHTASSISIIGWWTKARPGEISLAHKWVLFLDEILEFPKTVLEVLRQPLEDHEITVTRINSTFIYPAKFILLWAMNPCPCWYLTDPDKECICNPREIKSYTSRLSWPLIDRIDIFIEVPKVKTEDFSTKNDYSQIENSFSIKSRVEKSREIQLSRFAGTKITSNSEMGTKDINKFCKLDSESENLLKKAIVNMNLSARSYYRILKLARTIADLASREEIIMQDIAEALSYRKMQD